jgi:hypothetical protein
MAPCVGQGAVDTLGRSRGAVISPQLRYWDALAAQYTVTTAQLRAFDTETGQKADQPRRRRSEMKRSAARTPTTAMAATNSTW